MPRFPFTSPGKQIKSYDETLTTTTYYGAFVASIFYFFFILLYLGLDYPLPLVYFNILAFVCSGIGYYVMVRGGKRRGLAGILVVLSGYIALIGPSIFTGGIDASSLVWLIFIPAIAVAMLGPRAIFTWLALSLLTVIGMFVANRMGFDITLRPPQSTDRLIDLSSAIIAISIVAWLNERVKINAIMELERTQDELTHMASIDPLTEAYNRRYFMERAPAIIQNSNEGCLLLFDVDQFKQVNDTFGHTAGDVVLKKLYHLCKENIREGDMLVRFGGDEFILLLPNLSPERGAQTAERLCHVIANTPIETPKGASITASVSIGIVPYTAEQANDVDTLLHEADQAMYRAKQKGRNRVSF